jgi:hypothetical protein
MPHLDGTLSVTVQIAFNRVPKQVSIVSERMNHDFEER